MTRRTCALCGHVANVNSMKRMYVNSKIPNFVTIASLSLIGVVDPANVDTVVEKISRNQIYICHTHAVQAAQYICDELAASGRRFSYYEDPCAGGSTAYFNTADIPQHLVEEINGTSNGSFAITARDVWSFINTALKKYHRTYLWPTIQYEKEMGLEKDESVDEKLFTACSESAVKVEAVLDDNGDVIEKQEEDDDAACSSNAKVYEYNLRNDSRFRSISESRLVGRTDAADLQKYYLVKGELLLKVFRFCPECGFKLGKTQLKAAGTAAVVRFACDRCTIREHMNLSKGE